MRLAVMPLRCKYIWTLQPRFILHIIGIKSQPSDLALLIAKYSVL